MKRASYDRQPGREKIPDLIANQLQDLFSARILSVVRTVIFGEGDLLDHYPS